MERFGEPLQKKTYKELDSDQRRGKRRYQERLAEEKEAEKEIKEFVPVEQEKETIDSDDYHPNIS